MKLPKPKIIKDATNAYNKNIKALVNLKKINGVKMFLLIKQLTYQVTGNEDVLCQEKYDSFFTGLLINFQNIFDKLNDSSGNGLNLLLKEIDEASIKGNKMEQEYKDYFQKLLKNDKAKLKLINMVLLTLFITVCMKSAGYKVKFWNKDNYKWHLKHQIALKQ